MRLPESLRQRLQAWASKLMLSRFPNQVIGGEEDPYLLRWHVIPRNPLCNIYLHSIYRSDDDRALHDHPWPFVSLMLYGEYIEHRPVSAPWCTATTNERYVAGDVLFRRPRQAHRLEITAGKTALTLVITGPKVRKWGFWCPNGWRYWRDFVAADDHGAIGRGCE